MKNKLKGLTTRIVALALAIAAVFSMLPAISASAATNSEYTGGLGIANKDHIVYEWASGGAEKGEIFKNEGFTILYEVQGYPHKVVRIQYSTSNGMKDGYLIDYDITSYAGSTSVATVTTGSSVYYGPNTSTYERAGSVDTGEVVVVLESSNGWAFIEYNTSTSGRKRAYITTNKLDIVSPSRLSGLNIYNRNTQNKVSVSSTRPIYQGPSTTYNDNGSVSAADGMIQYFWWGGTNGEAFWYVEYTISSGKLKTGYLQNW